MNLVSSMLPEKRGAVAFSKSQFHAAGSGSRYCSSLFTYYSFLCAVNVRNNLKGIKEVIFSLNNVEEFYAIQESCV